MTHAEELLRAILDEQRNIVTELRKLTSKPSPTRSSAPTRAGVAEVAPASDAELDGEHGNPIVKWDPKYGWDGPSYAGSRFSDCPADYLEVVAKARESSAAKKPPGDPWIERDLQEASRARGWARRIRSQVLAEVKKYPLDEQQDDLGF